MTTTTTWTLPCFCLGRTMMPERKDENLPAEWRRGNGRQRNEWWFIYAPLDQVGDYLKMGWVERPWLKGTSHGLYSTYMEWLCDCPMPMRKPNDY